MKVSGRRAGVPLRDVDVAVSMLTRGSSSTMVPTPVASATKALVGSLRRSEEGLAGLGEPVAVDQHGDGLCWSRRAAKVSVPDVAW